MLAVGVTEMFGESEVCAPAIEAPIGKLAINQLSRLVNSRREKFIQSSCQFVA
jgi:hypothetical protein